MYDLYDVQGKYVIIFNPENYKFVFILFYFIFIYHIL